LVAFYCLLCYVWLPSAFIFDVIEVLRGLMEAFRNFVRSYSIFGFLVFLTIFLFIPCVVSSFHYKAYVFWHVFSKDHILWLLSSLHFDVYCSLGNWLFKFLKLCEYFIMVPCGPTSLITWAINVVVYDGKVLCLRWQEIPSNIRSQCKFQSKLWTVNIEISKLFVVFSILYQNRKSLVWEMFCHILSCITTLRDSSASSAFLQAVEVIDTPLCNDHAQIRLFVISDWVKLTYNRPTYFLDSCIFCWCCDRRRRCPLRFHITSWNEPASVLPLLDLFGVYFGF
jgi:hypothetical protein